MQSTQNYHLLFVDDESKFLGQICELIKQTEYNSTKIELCSSYQEAFSATSKIAQSHTPICFIDLSVSAEEDGFFIIEEIRKIREDAYFILLTGDKRAAIAQQSIEYGCLSHITKSTVSNVEELSIVLANVFARVSVEERMAFSRALRDIQISTQSFIHDVEKFLDNTISSLEEAIQVRRKEKFVSTALQNAHSVHRIFENYKNNIAVLNRIPRIKKIEARFLVGDINQLCATFGIDFEDNIIDNSDVIETDREVLFRAFTNIVDNSTKFTKHGTVPVARVEKSMEAIEFSFEDFGPGISEGYPGQILDYGKKGTNNSGKRGMGLGLWFTREVLEKMTQNNAEHKLRYSNKERSEGAVFKIIVPILPRDL